MNKKRVEKKVKKSNLMGVAGLALRLACLMSAYLMLFIRCTPPLIFILISYAMGVLGIVFCSIQIAKNSSKSRSIGSIIGMILAIIGASVDIVLMGADSCF